MTDGERETVSINFRENKTIFRKQEKSVRRTSEQMETMIARRKGAKVVTKMISKKRSEYFEALLNVLDYREVEEVCLGQGGLWSDSHGEWEGKDRRE